MLLEDECYTAFNAHTCIFVNKVNITDTISLQWFLLKAQSQIVLPLLDLLMAQSSWVQECKTIVCLKSLLNKNCATFKSDKSKINEEEPWRLWMIQEVVNRTTHLIYSGTKSIHIKAQKNQSCLVVLNGFLHATFLIRSQKLFMSGFWLSSAGAAAEFCLQQEANLEANFKSLSCATCVGNSRQVKRISCLIDVCLHYKKTSWLSFFIIFWNPHRKWREALQQKQACRIPIKWHSAENLQIFHQKGKETDFKVRIFCSLAGWHCFFCCFPLLDEHLKKENKNKRY